MTITKDNIISYLLDLKHTYNTEIEDILYSELSKSLTFKDLQRIDHLRNNISKIYKIIEFIEKEGI